MIMQDRDYLNQSAKVTGKGMNLKQQEEWQSQNRFVYACVETLEEGNLEAEAVLDRDPDNIFVLSQKAKHKVPHVFSSSNLTQKRKGVRKQKKQTKRICVEISSSVK